MSNKNIQQAIKKVAQANGINIDFSDLQKDLRSLNIDSLAAMNLIMQIEQELNVTVDDEKLITIKTLNDLIEAFSK